MTIYRTDDQVIHEEKKIGDGVWIQMINPTHEECEEIFGAAYLDKRYCKPEEVADLALFLASDVSSHNFLDPSQILLLMRMYLHFTVSWT